MLQHLRNPITLYYFANWLYRHRVPVLPTVLQTLLFLACNAVIPCSTTIGPGCVLGHGGSGVVIHPRARIGSNVMICQQVTIGGTGVGTGLPVIGDDVFIGAGAKILGPVQVGNLSVVGANAVVTRSVPPQCVVAGVPARVVKEGIRSRSLEEW